MLLGIFCSFLSSLMLIMSYSEGYTWCSFICLIPLLYFLSTHVKTISKIISIFTFLLLWNLYNYLFIIEFLNNIIGAFSPLVILPLVLLQAIPFLPLILNVRFKYQIFCSLWIILEYAILHSAINTPFSNLGIVASNYPALFQWLQFTGVLGSSLWILLCNVLCLWLIKSMSLLKQNQISPLPPIAYILLLFTPCFYSAISLYQPNINNDLSYRKVQVLSFSSSESQDSIQTKVIRTLKESECKKHTHYVVMPEFTTNLNNTKVSDAQFTGHLKSLLTSYKNNITFVYSASQEAWGKQQVLAIALDYQGIQQRNKEFLVPFAEYEPIAIKRLFEYKDIRYPTNYISKKENPTFKSLYDTYHVSICYEALFENFLKRKLQEPNGLIFVLAKEPFDGNMHYVNVVRLISKTQAITFQKPLIRSSWGGLSLVINSEGKFLAQSANKTGLIATYIQPNIKPSFYTRSKFNVLFFLAILSFLAFTIVEFKIKCWPKIRCIRSTKDIETKL